MIWINSDINPFWGAEYEKFGKFEIFLANCSYISFDLNYLVWGVQAEYEKLWMGLCVYKPLFISNTFDNSMEKW